eukprot:740536-Rhodomonas_salina.2
MGGQRGSRERAWQPSCASCRKATARSWPLSWRPSSGTRFNAPESQHATEYNQKNKRKETRKKNETEKKCPLSTRAQVVPLLRGSDRAGHKSLSSLLRARATVMGGRVDGGCGASGTRTARCARLQRKRCKACLCPAMPK